MRLVVRGSSQRQLGLGLIDGKADAAEAAADCTVQVEKT
jgi:hypothetical protein